MVKYSTHHRRKIKTFIKIILLLNKILLINFNYIKYFFTYFLRVNEHNLVYEMNDLGILIKAKGSTIKFQLHHMLFEHQHFQSFYFPYYQHDQDHLQEDAKQLYDLKFQMDHTLIRENYKLFYFL